ncbi:hypothetical protein ABIF63_003539 [Bradyrhizobium japonicum]|uniref:Phasin domain-containing protein n=4 Tax=Bradyrhizobium TaxID=374 RepID=A0ABV2RR69_BRAJP|nr:hypothetical protein [Bradyrhizobium japonicum]MCS3502818.1 hypothetical protein [Bradyrhizobium japonicum]MCS3964466.1 hypothetical protein [Bradyrhizobium japonicum]MCS3996775.1 hypothetical protein [Bradyrhizobium japonicum]UQD97215.1 hypothetical protein JEY30_37920 [Bradyrhizobium japonicum]WLB17328.1 hypothetical protein QIH95_35800 [Bradyrhizobium japonicum]
MPALVVPIGTIIPKMGTGLCPTLGLAVLIGAGTSGNSTGFRTVCVAWLCAEASMKTKLSGKLSHYDKMAASAQQFFTEATACREEAARSLDQVDREGWLKLAREWTELALAAERGQIFRRD